MKLEITLPQRDILMLQDLCSFLHMFVVVYVAALVFLDYRVVQCLFLASITILSLLHALHLQNK
jgi:hypothetical protein